MLKIVCFPPERGRSVSCSEASAKSVISRVFAPGVRPRRRALPLRLAGQPGQKLLSGIPDPHRREWSPDSGFRPSFRHRERSRRNARQCRDSVQRSAVKPSTQSGEESGQLQRKILGGELLLSCLRLKSTSSDPITNGWKVWINHLAPEQCKKKNCVVSGDVFLFWQYYNVRWRSALSCFNVILMM